MLTFNAGHILVSTAESTRKRQSPQYLSVSQKSSHIHYRCAMDVTIWPDILEPQDDASIHHVLL
jgi:hypothetical protein